MSDQCSADKPCAALLKIKGETIHAVGLVKQDFVEQKALLSNEIKHLSNEMRDLREALNALPHNMAAAVEREMTRMAERLKRGEGKFDSLFDRMADVEAKAAASQERLDAGAVEFANMTTQISGLGSQMNSVRRWLQWFAMALGLILLGKGAVWAWPAIEKLLGMIP